MSVTEVLNDDVNFSGVPVSGHVADRWIRGPTYVIADGDTAPHITTPITSLLSSSNVKAMRNYYAFYRFKEIEVKMVFNCPKGITGYAFVGWYPFTDVADIPDAGRLSSREDSVLVSYGAPSDVTLHIPYTYRSPMLSTSTPTPSVYSNIMILPQRFSIINGLVTDIPVNIFYRFVGLEFFGPSYKVQSRSHSNPVKAMVDEISAAASVLMGGDLLSGPMGRYANLFKEVAGATQSLPLVDKNSELHPTHQMPCIIGDISSCVPTKQSGIKAPYMPNINPGYYADCEEKHPISSFVTRPQYYGSITVDSTSTRTFTHYPSPSSAFNPQSTDPNFFKHPTWLQYFAYCSRYWAGSMYMHFVVASSEFQTIQASISVSYNGSADANVDTTKSIFETFSGDKVITVPLPYLAARDFYDTIPYELNGTMMANADISPWVVTSTFTIPSFFCDGTPMAHVAVFLSAGPDFRYYQPEPPGFKYMKVPAASSSTLSLSSMTVGTPTAVKGSIANVYDAQCKFKASQTVVDTDIQYCERLSPMLELSSVEQLSQMWSTCWAKGVYADSYLPAVLGPALCYSHGSLGLGSQDFVSMAARIFLRFKGSVSHKIINKPDNTTPVTYLSQTPQNYPWSAPGALPGTSPKYVPANPGVGLALTSPNLQPVLDATFTPFGRFFASETAYLSTSSNPYDHDGVPDIIYRRCGSDIQFFTELLVPLTSFA